MNLPTVLEPILKKHKVYIKNHSYSFDNILRNYCHENSLFISGRTYNFSYLGLRRRSDELGRGFRDPRAGPLFSTTGVTYGIPDGS